jgi:UDP-N-acetylmuramate dehydrogenase
VQARYRTTAQDEEQGEQLLREITRWRRRHQPGGTYNAGSVFKNPPGDSAGRIIDSAGLKGFRVGGAAVSTRHANFFVADQTATAQDVYDLVWSVRRMVAEATSVTLEPEIRFVGSFLTPDRLPEERK